MTVRFDDAAAAEPRNLCMTGRTMEKPPQFMDILKKPPSRFQLILIPMRKIQQFQFTEYCRWTVQDR
ncbi:hypothetical protein [Rhodomicrobium vannielii]|uniref:hypothetical protein n=1 Tax=Rhodomicrobium vannielii TaxID=1069 RepID=UPI000B4BA6A6|nr:hypothetical protein [Rhodomicrobium vannielii]